MNAIQFLGGLTDMDNKWFEKSYRRNLVDMHIADWDDRFMSEFDPKKYADMMKLGEVDTAIIYASSCLGICYWPTKVGHMHNGLKGRDIVGEVIKECQAKEINVVVYFNIWSKWAFEQYPDWRIINANGQNTKEEGIWGNHRFGICCPNSPFRDYVKAQIEDLCTNYEFAGMWIDMIGWFGKTCCCHHCKARFLQETGLEMPETVDWTDPVWVALQRKREAWQAEFTAMITTTAKAIKPHLSMTFQCTTWFAGWGGGPSHPFFAQNDYLAGDFYGDSIQQSFICKFLNSISRHKPIEFMTSRCYDLSEHTTIKTRELLEAQIYSSLGNNASFVFIDAIDPVGTLNAEVYAFMGSIFKETKKYEPYMDTQAELCADVGVYLNFESLINLEDNGKPIHSATTDVNPIGSSQNVAKSLMDANITYDVISNNKLQDLDRYQVIVLSDIAVLGPEELEAFRNYVAAGGSLYASKNTSRFTLAGGKGDQFQLSDLFGVSYAGETIENVTYMSPVGSGEAVMPGNSRKYGLMINGTQLNIQPDAGVEVLATVTLPYSDPKETERFTSALAEPPGVYTDNPSIVLNTYGKGKVIYTSGKLEGMEQETHRNVFVQLINRLLGKPLAIQANAPKSVEITLFHQRENNKYVINLLNFQKELPNIPIPEIEVKVRMNGKQPVSLLRAPGEIQTSYTIGGDYLQFKVNNLETFDMYILEVR